MSFYTSQHGNTMGRYMFLRWDSARHTTEIEFRDGSTLSWNCKSWNRAKLAEPTMYHGEEDIVTPDIFYTINRYINTLPVETVDRIELIYKTIHNDLDMGYKLVDLTTILSAHVDDLFKCFNWKEFAQWMYAFGGQNLNIGVKEVLNETDIQELTYFTQDYKDLVFLSVLLKLMTPIWGVFHNLMETELGPERVLIYAVYIIENDTICSNPAYKRLRQLVNDFIKANLKSDAYTITYNIGSDEVPDYLTAIALWKKIIPFDGRTKDGSAIKNLFAILKDRCARLDKAGPKQKTNKGGDNKKSGGDDLSIVDTYKIISPLPIGTVTGISTYINLGRLHVHVDSNMSVKDVHEVHNKLPPDFDIMEYHLPILAWIFNPTIGCRNLHLLDYLDIKTLLAIGSVALNMWGYPTLSELLITTPSIKNPKIIQSGKYILPVTPEKITMLTNIFKFTGAVNPGITLITTINNVMAGYDWEFEKGDIENTANELADLMIALDGKR